MGILVLLVLVLVTLENKVNSNSDQFKFVQLSSKSGWSLTKDMHIQILISDKSLNKYFENATLSVKQKLRKTLRNEIRQFNKNRQASNVNAAKQEEQN